METGTMEMEILDTETMEMEILDTETLEMEILDMEIIDINRDRDLNNNNDYYRYKIEKKHHF